MGAITLPRLINKLTNMQAASPVQELNRLYSLLGEWVTFTDLFLFAASLINVSSM